MVVALPYTNTSGSIQTYTWNTFGELAVTFTPLRMVNIETQSLYFSCIYPQFDRLLWLNYACPCPPIYRVSRYG